MGQQDSNLPCGPRGEASPCCGGGDGDRDGRFLGRFAPLGKGGGGSGSSSSSKKASPCAASRCTRIFRKPLLAAVPAQLQPGTSGLESLRAACNYAADKRSHFTNADPLGEVLHGKWLKIVLPPHVGWHHRVPGPRSVTTVSCPRAARGGSATENSDGRVLQQGDCNGHRRAQVEWH